MESTAIPWIVAPIVLPLVAATLACLLRVRTALAVCLLASSGTVLAVAGLGLQILAHGPQRYQLAGWDAPLGIELYADGLSVAMLLTTALVGTATSFYAVGYFSGERSEEKRAGDLGDKSGSFWPLWMFLFASLNGLFLSADIFNIYITLEILGISSVALVALGGDRLAVNAGMRYLLVSLLGSLAYLFAVGLLYGAFGTLSLEVLGEVVVPVPATYAALALMTVGLALKTALFPLHFWLPQAHANAPTPVSALLSALVVKGSFYLIVRLWFDVFPDEARPVAGQLLGLLGAAAIVWGSVLALRQRRLKLLVAYSTVAQIGYLFLLFPLAVTAGSEFEAWSGGVYHAFSHAFAKGSMFMAAGAIMKVLDHDEIDGMDGIFRHMPLSVASFAVAGVTLMGVPPSGGFTAKWLLLSAAVQNNSWALAVVIVAGGLLAAAYLFLFLNRALINVPTGKINRPAPHSMEVAAFVMAAVSLSLGLLASPLLGLLRVGAPFAAQLFLGSA
jgi:multicomponent Na+:H+ antiporter subunit D